MKLIFGSLRNSVVISCVLVFLATVFVLSCNFGPPENSRAVQARKGQVHFMEYCASCHGSDGKGIAIDTLDLMPADLTRINARRRQNEFPALTIARIIDGRSMSKSHGDRDMPVWGDVFSQEEYLDESQIKGKLAEIIAFLINIQGT